jgi:hypothetical protein
MGKGPAKSLKDFATGGSMKLREFFEPGSVELELAADSKAGILRELVELLDLDEQSRGVLYKTLKRRENLGSTGIGKRIAIRSRTSFSSWLHPSRSPTSIYLS